MKNVLVAEWSHETNTFSKSPTTLESFTKFSAIPYLDKYDEIKLFRGAHTKTSHGATFQSAEKYDWNLVTTISSEANPSGMLTNEAFETLSSKILEKLSEGIEFHGIVLHLHGAMVSESFEDCEGELLRRIRSIVGKAIPIIVTLDLHGNITELMTEHASAFIAVRTYPHVDFYEMALRACDLLQQAMLGLVLPTTVISRGRADRQQLRGLDGGKTTEPDGPMNVLLRRAQALEDSPSGEVLVVSICAGFSAADIHDAGPSVTVTVDLLKFDGDAERARKMAKDTADEYMDFVWETRRYQSAKHKSVPEAISFALTHQEALDGPVVLAEVTDNPGSGHYGDATNLLRALVESPLKNVLFYAIFDPTAALRAQQVGVGNSADLTVGGNTDPSAGGGPLLLREARVVALTDGCFQTFGPMGGGGAWQDFGLSALLRVGSLELVIISKNQQLLDLAQISSLGVDPFRKQTIVCKSNHHFRACLSAVVGSASSERIATVDGGGLGSLITSLHAPYRRVRRPIWPLDSPQSEVISDAST